MKNTLFLILFLFVAASSQAQFITGIGTKWSDEFTEWTIYTDDEEVEGEIIMRWQMQRDWTVWDYSLGEESGSIRQKWKGDPNQWEISGGDELITARTLFKDDPTEWRITNNTQTIKVKSRWSNNFNEWKLKSSTYGDFSIEADWEGDPREWNVEDYLEEEISVHMKIAILFIVTFHSSPKG